MRDAVRRIVERVKRPRRPNVGIGQRVKALTEPPYDPGVELQRELVDAGLADDITEDEALEAAVLAGVDTVDLDAWAEQFASWL